MRQVLKATGATLAMLMLVACAQTTAQAPTGRTEAELADTLPDMPGTGPFPAIKEVVSGLPDHVIYRPAQLNGLGPTKLGVLLWGNGGCRADGASARQHLLEIASHGYVAIAPGTIRSGPGATSSRQAEGPREDGSFPPVETTPENMVAALDWILAENGRAASPWYQRIDPVAIAVAGHSCGGLQAIKLSADPRVATTVVQNSGVLNPGSDNPIRGLTVEKAELGNLHAPVLYVLGGQRDVAWPNGMDDYARINHVPVAVANLDVGHGGTFAQPNGGRAAQIVWRWLDWRLRGDTAAGAWFAGDACQLCTSREWQYASKRLE